MNNHSLLRIITLFFLLIFLLINGLFWIANQHFTKEEEAERMRRFALADRLFHHPDGNFKTELKELMIRPSSISPALLQSKGKNISLFPFGKVIQYNNRIYFVKIPPTMLLNDRHPPFWNRFPPPMSMPPPEFFSNIVLEDLRPQSLWPIWIVFVAIDFLILLFFGYLVGKLLPLQRLKDAIIHFKEGDTHLKIPISGKDEISQITQEFNQVLQKIASIKEARSLFLRNILHELKTPIMKGSLTTDCLSPSTDQDRLKRIFNRMGYLLDEFTKMEQFSSGEWRLNMQEYRFVDILDHTCDILLCDKKSLTIKREESALIVNVDFDLFAIALKNLLDNAFRYSSTKPTLIILKNCIEICSIGEPIPDENRIFTKPFNRSYESSLTGLGLGLYITNAILQKHGYTLQYHYASGLNCFKIIF
jgi:two-component system OmpR family sensor kinase